MKRPAVLFLAVAALYLGVALPLFIPAPHTGGDNAGYLSLAVSLLERGDYVELWDPAEPPHTKYPPVFPLLLAGAMLLGARSWVAFKALSVVAVGGAVLLSLALARRRLGTVGGLAVALLLVLSDAFLWASAWILSEPLFLVLSLGAVVALEAGVRGRSGEGESEGGEEDGTPRDRRPLPPAAALFAGCTLAILAYFTRSAGLPLVAAVGAWLLLRKAWRPALAFAVAFGVPAFLWMLRGRSSRAEGYLSEFWMVDPYQPELGRVGLGGLAARAVDNLVLYGTEYIPRGLTPVGGGWIPILGVGLLLLAAAGWARAVRRGLGPAELFVPLYAVLILLWPAVWSGDRFALPLYPFLLIYAADVVRAAALRVGGRGGMAVGAAAVLSVALPAVSGWWQGVPSSTGCRAVVKHEGPFGCYQQPVREWAESARWSASALPQEAVVFSRKPRLFYVVSGGIRSLTFPFSDDPDLFFREAERSGVEYLLVDRLDSLAPLYLVPVISARPERFCALAGWGNPEGVRTELLGILPDGEGVEAPEGAEEGTVTIRRCPPEYVADALRPEIPFTSMEVPLLRRLREGR